MRYFGPKTAAYYKRMHEALFATTVDDYRPVIKSADGIWVTDLDGNKFLDFTSQVGIINTGHNPEEVVSAIREQATLATGMITNDFQFSSTHKFSSLKHEEVSPVRLAEELIRLTPVPHPKKVLFEVSGATAINAATKICLAASPGKKKFLAFKKAFHGRHGPSLDLSSSKEVHKLLHQPGLDVLRIEFPSRGTPFKLYMEALVHELDRWETSLNAIFVEIVQGEGGINIPELKILNFLRREAKKRGFIFVVDEVQTGLGRTGKLFASEYLNSPPDVLVLSKSLGAGVPIGAVVARTDILPAGDLTQGAHSGTMPASPLACAAAFTTLKLLEESRLVEKGEILGKYLLEGLHEVIDGHPAIVDIDSLGGLMIRMEFASKSFCEEVILECLSQEPGLLLIEAGDKTIRFMPPLSVSREEIDLALEILDRALERLNQPLG